MIVKYIGHACFKVRDNETGYSIIFDPYKPGSVPGFHDIVDAASEVICSHEHFDHNCRDAVMIEPKDESPFDITVIETWHDPEKGALRGSNNITIVTDKRNGEKLIHYGDIGEVMDDLLTPENLRLLSGAGIALIPVGGTYTYDEDEALELIRRTEPKIAVPMHFRTETGVFGFPNIGSIESFIVKARKADIPVHIAKVCFYDTSEYDLSGCILALRPQNV